MKRAILLVLVPFLAGVALCALLSDRSAPQGQDAWAALEEEAAPIACSSCRGAKTEPPSPSKPTRPRGEANSDEDGPRRTASTATLILDLRHRGRRLPVEAQVTLGGEDWNLRKLWRPEERRFTAPAGRSHLTVLPASVALFRHGIVVDLEPGAVVKKTVELPGAAKVFGRVRGCEAYPMELSYVIWNLARGSPSPYELASNPDQACATAGSFIFEGLEPGPYLIGVTADEHCAEPLMEVEVGAAPVVLDLDLPPPDPARCLELAVFDASGARCRSSDWTASIGGSGSEEIASRRGDLLVYHCPRMLEESELYLAVSHPKLGALNAAVTPRDRRLELRFAEPARLTVLLPMTATPRAVGEPISVSWQGWETGEAPSAELGASGRAVFEALSPGRGVLAVKVGERPIIERELTLDSGPRTLALDWPELGRLEILTRAGVRRSFRLRLDEESVRVSPMPSSGRIALENLTRGFHRLYAFGRERWVTVPGPPVVIPFGPTRSLRVHIDDPSGALARLGFEDGDRILSIDGAVPAGLAEFPAGPRAVVLRRDGRRRRLMLNLRALFEQTFLMGGRLEPQE